MSPADNRLLCFGTIAAVWLLWAYLKTRAIRRDVQAMARECLADIEASKAKLKRLSPTGEGPSRAGGESGGGN